MRFILNRSAFLPSVARVLLEERSKVYARDPVTLFARETAGYESTVTKMENLECKNYRHRHLTTLIVATSHFDARHRHLATFIGNEPF